MMASGSASRTLNSTFTQRSLLVIASGSSCIAGTFTLPWGAAGIGGLSKAIIMFTESCILYIVNSLLAFRQRGPES